MDKQKVNFSVKTLLGTSLAMTFLLNIFLPSPNAEGIMKLFLFLLEVLLISLGPIVSLVAPSPYFEHTIYLLVIGIISFISWVIFITKKESVNILILPIFIWVTTGAWFTFWSLASGV